MKKSEKKLRKMLLLSLFIKRVFYSSEDIDCTCDNIAIPAASKSLIMESFWCLR